MYDISAKQKGLRDNAKRLRQDRLLLDTRRYTIWSIQYTLSACSWESTGKAPREQHTGEGGGSVGGWGRGGLDMESSKAEFEEKKSRKESVCVCDPGVCVCV